ncbi:hypothetical protein [uncultured Bradyrhizobium sp.]|uniref:hypothetical protein n=1 Tax=Bradyrhizobium sp. TaxID=376 RepID=UPI00262AB8CC|nr:hypothetical protein [uncultured Bradyrhizobium sp.]
MTQHGVAPCRHVFAVRYTAHPPAQPRGERLLSCVLVHPPERLSGLDPAGAFGAVQLVRTASADSGPHRAALQAARLDLGICWFDPDAREAISRARYCAWLLEEGGLPVRTITTSRQREVLWRDAHQIVTKPSAELPKAFA